MLDRFGAGPMVIIPHYQAINEVPLPCVRNKQGMITSLMRCFNCGSSNHNLRDCKIKRDRECVQMNKSWMQEYARIGVKKSRDHEVHSRYFIQNQPDSKGDKSLNEYKQAPSNDNESNDKPPDLQIITEDMELPAPKKNRRQNSRNLDESYRNSNHSHNGRGNSYNGRSNSNNQNSRRGPEGQNYGRSQHDRSRSWLLNGPAPGPRGGSHYGPRPHRSRRNQAPYQRMPYQSGRWKSGRDARARA